MKIYKNFLKKNTFENINKILFSNEFPWYFNNKKENLKDFYYFHLLFYNNKQSSNYFNDIVMPILGNLNFNYLINSECNLFIKKKSIFNNNTFDKYEKEYSSIIYSLNDSDGYIFFKNGEKIILNKNELIIFNGDLEHCNISPINENIKINIKINVLK